MVGSVLCSLVEAAELKFVELCRVLVSGTVAREIVLCDFFSKLRTADAESGTVLELVPPFFVLLLLVFVVVVVVVVLLVLLLLLLGLLLLLLDLDFFIFSVFYCDSL